MQKSTYFNRDLSWLSFNQRVLQEAADVDVPLYERIKFLAIYSSNLDEFFRVRVALIKRMAVLNKEKLMLKMKLQSPKNLLREIYEEVNKQQTLFGEILRDSILKELLLNKVHIYYNETYHTDHLSSVEDIFYSRILSFIQPLVISTDEPKPIFLGNRMLYMVCELEKDGSDYLGVVNIPSQFIPRFQHLPSSDGIHHYTFIDDILKSFSHIIFAGFVVKSHHNVKLNRDAELFLDDDYSDNLINKIKKGLKNRNVGIPSRFLYEPGINPKSLSFLQKLVSLQKEDCISGGNYHNLDDLFGLPNPIGGKLNNPPLPALPHKDFNPSGSIFQDLDKKDVLLCFPYHRYDYILRFFNEAAINPSVSSIQATLYRVAENSHITNALISAVRNGKTVEILVEAKARFDEENNMKWAEKMADAGVTVRYSEQMLKVHAKVALITCQPIEGVRKQYAFLGTGNFNEKTADVYTDYALLTSDSEITSELADTLAFTFGHKETVKLKHLLVAQVNMPQKFNKLIDGEISQRKLGKKGHIVLKLNNLQDKKMIRKLYQAADEGVQIDLIVRGICCLVPRKNINLRRVVDRFLEHSRVYIFGVAEREKIYLGSADWMDRNLYRRIEVVFPVYDKAAIEVVKRNIYLLLKDNVKASIINEKLDNVPVNVGKNAIHTQPDFYTFLQNN